MGNIKEYLDLINDMLLDDSYCFASGTLEGIKKFVKTTDYITEGQMNAIDNILNSVPYSETYKEWR